ncbi:alpha/beta hydrolase family protein [Amycolatopsis thermoflava]|uniref:alpha/beta hydrolase family protein n=1 Tax=Amycolatopsis thermoflava TaxID=84480 RepID=UPI003655946E
MRRLARALVAALLLTAGTAVPASAADQCLAGASCLDGRLADGTPYLFVKPDHWQGTVIVGLDFASSGLADPLTARLVDRGIAVGGTTRTVTGWNIARAIDNQAEALSRFEAASGPARWAIASGESMGGFVSAGAAQVHPEVFDAAVPFCGGLGGAVGQWNQKLDTVFTLKTLLFPDRDLPVTGIPADVPGAQQAWISALAGAQATPEGRARIALAGAIGQLPEWGLAADGSETPLPRTVTERQEGTYLALAGGPLPYIGQAMSSRRQIEQLAGGNPSWNTGVDYARQLGNDPAVRELYRRAGLDLGADLARLAAAPRIAADPAAVAYLSRGIVFDGELDIPVLTVNGTGDQISTVAQQQSYGAVVRSAGNGPLLRQTYVQTAGHCTFTADEQETAIEVMLDRLRTGHWPSTAPRVMGGRYVPYSPPVFNRPFTATVSPGR